MWEAGVGGPTIWNTSATSSHTWKLICHRLSLAISQADDLPPLRWECTFQTRGYCRAFLQNSSEYSLLDSMSEFSASAIAPTVASVTANLLVRVYYVLATFLGDSLQYLILYTVSNLSYWTMLRKAEEGKEINNEKNAYSSFFFFELIFF